MGVRVLLIAKETQYLGGLMTSKRQVLFQEMETTWDHHAWRTSWSPGWKVSYKQFMSVQKAEHGSAIPFLYEGSKRNFTHISVVTALLDIVLRFIDRSLYSPPGEASAFEDASGWPRGYVAIDATILDKAEHFCERGLVEVALYNQREWEMFREGSRLFVKREMNCDMQNAQQQTAIKGRWVFRLPYCYSSVNSMSIPPLIPCLYLYKENIRFHGSR